MDSKNQFFVFCLCIAVGFVGGFLYEIFAVLRLIFGCERGKNKFLGSIFDFFYFVIFAIFCIFASFFLRFSGFRVYIWLGFGVGGILYIKTLRRILAFFQKLCYNKICILVQKAKSKKILSNSGG